MVFNEAPRDLGSLVVLLAGSVATTGEEWEPYRLCDGAGGPVAEVAAYLRELQACGRSVATQRSYAMDLLRWYRFLWAVGVAWDHATSVEARDFARWIGSRTSRGGCIGATAPRRPRLPATMVDALVLLG